MSNPGITAALIQELTNYDSPYSNIGDVIYAQSVKNPYPYRMSTGDAIGTGLAQGLSAGLFQAYGKSQEEERNQMIAQALSGGLNKEAIAQLSADPETRSAATMLGVALAEQENAQKQMLAEQLLKDRSALLKQGFRYDPLTGQAEEIAGFGEALASQEAAKAEAAARAKFPYQERLANIRSAGSGVRPVSEVDLGFLNSNPGQEGSSIPAGVSYEALRIKNYKDQQAGVQSRYENAALPEAVNAKVMAAMDANEMLPLLIKRLKEFEGKPGINLTGLTRDAFLRNLPTSERSLLDNWMRYSAMESILGVLGKQGLSDKDVKVGMDFLANPEALVTGDLSPRFEKILHKTRVSAISGLRTAKRQKKFENSALSVADEFLRTIPEGEQSVYQKMIFNASGDEASPNGAMGNTLDKAPPRLPGESADEYLARTGG